MDAQAAHANSNVCTNKKGRYRPFLLPTKYSTEGLQLKKSNIIEAISTASSNSYNLLSRHVKFIRITRLTAFVKHFL